MKCLQISANANWIHLLPSTRLLKEQKPKKPSLVSNWIINNLLIILDFVGYLKSNHWSCKFCHRLKRGKLIDFSAWKPAKRIWTKNSSCVRSAVLKHRDRKILNGSMDVYCLWVTGSKGSYHSTLFGRFKLQIITRATIIALSELIQSVQSLRT